MYSKVNHPESNRLRSTCEGDLQQLGVYRRFATRDYDDRREEESISFGRALSLARARSEVHASRLFTPHIVRFDERKRRRSDLRPVVCPVRGRVAESLSSRRCLHQVGDYCIISAPLWGAPVVSVEGTPFLQEVQSK